MSNKLTKQRSDLAAKLFKKPAGELKPCDLSVASFIPKGMTRAFKNNRFVVMVYDNVLIDNGKLATKALIQRLDNTPIPNHWKEIQSIKNEIFGEEVTGIEYYPKQSKLMDTHNIYWLWIFPDGTIPEYNPF
ncbi:MAG: hypothetical protein JWQ09_5819 [Segetibacter sp.]|nr:hypothetical protein [Segetibacter sp.]